MHARWSSELRALRQLLELEWPGYAQSVEPVALDDAPAAVADALAELGWSPRLGAVWPDPRATSHEELVDQWLREGRLEYAELDDESDHPDDDADPIATAFPVTRDDLPARLRVLRHHLDGGDFTLWVTDERDGAGDPAVLELCLRPGEPGAFVRALPERACRFIARWISRDLGEQRAHGALVGLSEPERHGTARFPHLIPELLDVAPDVYLELDLARHARPHRVTSHDHDALARWLATLPASEVARPATILTVPSVVRLPLSLRVREVLAALEPDLDRRRTVAARLYDDVQLPATTAGRIALFERIRLAVLKLAAEQPGGLDRGLALAAIDWRDLLVEADLGEAEAHVEWAARVARPR